MGEHIIPIALIGHVTRALVAAQSVVERVAGTHDADAVEALKEIAFSLELLDEQGALAGAPGAADRVARKRQRRTPVVVA